ncbi:hypothetical protein I3J09_01850 [Streptomyces clavuligerus]|uniref:DUF6087 family protein n=1 Tax=Streptomyces clavuligerus TaxID=1901 RepID=UPI0008106E92|nr:DUF6087 family protein [Streptomyces clavuligerus]ANW17065.1 hypothetical protein BB341_01880 [Streptomyces clavuligerus]AXU11601.1 hypothetical protein D1794_01985 [Streptomyces clavuligerus]MBY6301424.1 hypothetical protein [Streptomyces clavuligerus]QPL61719.1 hypothetical protein I3J04_01850 [Streptomyces clavuligerus]QPL67751.1 hypothetical protein I3J05_01865 [Streptomyces clavuligerus]
MDDEPLAQWAERRDARIGRLRAVPFTPGPGPRGAHLCPQAPRAIERWNGHLWEPYAVVSSLAEAQRLLYPGSAGGAPVTGRAPRH